MRRRRKLINSCSNCRGTGKVYTYMLQGVRINATGNPINCPMCEGVGTKEKELETLFYSFTKNIAKLRNMKE